MALILSIETGTEVCSVALGRDGQLMSLLESDRGRNHANNLAQYIDEILTENDLDADDLDAVAVGGGPGSYTGLRIGVSTAKGICYSLDKPLIAVNPLEALAEMAIEEYEAGVAIIENPDTAVLCPMIDARRMEVYTQLYDMRLNPLTEVEAKVIGADSFAEYKNLVLFGDGAEKCHEVIGERRSQLLKVSSSARGMVELAERKFVHGQFVDVAYYEPFYLKDFVAKISQKNILAPNK